MINTLSSLSLKRDRSTSTTSKKESKINAFFTKLVVPFYSSTGSHKKQRQQDSTSNPNRRSSLSAIADLFRTTTTVSDNSPSIEDEKPQPQHAFANDDLFEHNRYQRQRRNHISFDGSTATTSNIGSSKAGILMKLPASSSPSPSLHTKSHLFNHKPYHHRHTKSSPSNTTFSPHRHSTTHHKHTRHYSHVSCISSSNITVNSEDLTAQEFADIAGIRILSEQEQDDYNTKTHHSAAALEREKKKVCTFCGDSDETIPSLILNTSRLLNNNSSGSGSGIGSGSGSAVAVHNQSRMSEYSWMSHDESMQSSSSSCNSSIIIDQQQLECSEEDGPQIWDMTFWMKPGQETQKKQQASSKQEPQPKLKLLSASILDQNTPLLNELKKQNNTATPMPTFIKRGRFEISSNSDSSSQQVLQHRQKPTDSNDRVIEWARKSKS